MKLIVKVSALVVCVALIPALSVLVFTLKVVSDHHFNSNVERMQHKVELSAQLLAHHLQTAVRETEIYSQHEAIKSMQAEQFLPVLKSELARHAGRYEKFILGTKEGHFYNTSGGNPHFNMLRTFDDRAEDTKPKNILKRDYWQATVGNNENGLPISVVSSPMISFTTGARQVVVATAITQANHVQGMIGLAIDWQRIVSLIKTIKYRVFEGYNKQVKMFLTTQDGTYWYHWNSKRIPDLERDQFGHLLLGDDGQSVTRLHNIREEGIPGIAQVAENLLANKPGRLFFHDDSAGKEFLLLHQPVGQLGYSLGIVMEKSALRPSFIFLPYVLMIFLISIVLVVGGALYWNKRMLISPLELLINNIRLLKAGRYPQQATSPSKDEFSRASQTLSEMAMAIEDREQALTESETRFELAMAGANDGLWDWDIVRDEIYFSVRWCEIVGYKEADIPHKFSGILTLIHSEDRAAFQQRMNAFLDGQETRFQDTLRMVHADGSSVYILSRAFLIREAETGNPVRLIGTHVDITDQKQYEHEIQRMNHALEKRISERTHDLELANEKLEKLSMQDGLTQVGNRRALDIAISRMHSYAKRHDKQYSVMLIDIDFFKKYNDFYGHQAGDAALIELAERLVQTVRQEDEVYRYGGEEFMVLLPETDNIQSISLAGRIIDAVKHWHAPHEKSDFGYITVSIGLATCRENDIGSKAVMKRADDYLYQAKEAGRNQVVYAA